MMNDRFMWIMAFASIILSGGIVFAVLEIVF